MLVLQYIRIMTIFKRLTWRIWISSIAVKHNKKLLSQSLLWSSYSFVGVIYPKTRYVRYDLDLFILYQCDLDVRVLIFAALYIHFLCKSIAVWIFQNYLHATWMRHIFVMVVDFNVFYWYFVHAKRNAKRLQWYPISKKADTKEQNKFYHAVFQNHSSSNFVASKYRLETIPITIIYKA